MYYAYNDTNQTYYVLDEELKVLRISDVEPTGITKIEVSLLGENNSDVLGITGNTIVSDFLSNENYRSITYNLFVSMYNTVMIPDGDTNRYVNRDDIKELVTNVQFAKGYTLLESYDRVVITTSTGFVIDIGKPQDNLEYKVNLCFSAIDDLKLQGESKGTIKYTYLENGDERISFIRDNDVDGE